MKVWRLYGNMLEESAKGLANNTMSTQAPGTVETVLYVNSVDLQAAQE